MPRPRKRLPAGAREYVLQCAEGAALAETKIARGLGMGFATWRRILKTDPDAQALWTEAKAVERDTIVQKLYDRALEGDVQASRFLLGARHGLREQGAAEGAEGRSSVTINLPGSMSAAQYKRMVSVEPEAVEHDG